MLICFYECLFHLKDELKSVRYCYAIFANNLVLVCCALYHLLGCSDDVNHVFIHFIYSVLYFTRFSGWLMVVQAFVTLALMLSFSSQIIIALELIRWPLEFVLLYEWLLSGIAFICNALAGNLMDIVAFGLKKGVLVLETSSAYHAV
jgi:hypothetical protein